MTKKNAKKLGARALKKEHGGSYQHHLRSVGGGNGGNDPPLPLEPNLVLVPDYEAHGCVPGLCCQVIALEEMESKRDVTHLVDQGRYWHSLREIEAHILRTTGRKVNVEMAEGEVPLDADAEDDESAAV